MQQGREKNNDKEKSDNDNDSHEATSLGRGRHTSTPTSISILNIKNKMKEAGENVKASRVRWLLLCQPFGKDNNNPVSRWNLQRRRTTLALPVLGLNVILTLLTLLPLLIQLHSKFAYATEDCWHIRLHLITFSKQYCHLFSMVFEFSQVFHSIYIYYFINSS